MGRIRGWVKRLEHAARKDLASFELLDGSRYYYDKSEVDKQLFIHTYYLQIGRRPEPPEVLTKLCQARNPAAVLERFRPERPEQAFVDLAACYDIDALVKDRRLVPYEVDPPQDLSEP
jgi:hypothetical protein